MTYYVMRPRELDPPGLNDTKDCTNSTEEKANNLYSTMQLKPVFAILAESSLEFGHSI